MAGYYIYIALVTWSKFTIELRENAATCRSENFYFPQANWLLCLNHKIYFPVKFLQHKFFISAKLVYLTIISIKKLNLTRRACKEFSSSCPSFIKKYSAV